MTRHGLTIENSGTKWDEPPYWTAELLMPPFPRLRGFPLNKVRAAHMIVAQLEEER